MSDKIRKGQKEKALKIMKCLREGLHPLTGEEISNDSVFQLSHVTRALFEACDAIEFQIKAETKREKRREENNKNKPPKQGQRWFPEEEDILRNELENQMKIIDIAKAHQRSVVSIEKRIEKLNI